MRRRGGKMGVDAPPTLAHALPLAIAWALVAVIFFFPGLWKLLASGPAWFASDNLRNQMYWKWYQAGALPPLRIDRYPLLCRAGALGIVLFELGFGALLLSRRTRPLAVIGALVFHGLCRFFLHIRYPSLWLCYVMFVDWRAVYRYAWRGEDIAGAASDPPPARRRVAALAPAIAAGAVLLGGNLWLGARGVYRAFPFACYPTFQWMVGTSMPRLSIELSYPDGRIAEVPLPRDPDPGRRPKQWGLEWSLAGVTDPADPARLRAHFEALVKRPEVAVLAREAVSVRVYRAFYSVIPEAWGDPPVRRVLLAAWRVAP